MIPIFIQGTWRSCPSYIRTEFYVIMQAPVSFSLMSMALAFPSYIKHPHGLLSTGVKIELEIYLLIAIFFYNMDLEFLQSDRK